MGMVPAGTPRLAVKMTETSRGLNVHAHTADTRGQVRALVP